MEESHDGSTFYERCERLLGVCAALGGRPKDE